jgi:AcrR family transcriptional regulator
MAGRTVAVGLTSDQIVETAVALMDEHGQEWLTMRRLAEHLGVAAPTLYWHVR